MSIFVAEAGNYEVKSIWDTGFASFNSCIGEGRERRLVSEYYDEMIVKYDDQMYFAGSLAEYESRFKRWSSGMSKNHEDAKLRILIAVHRFGIGDKFKLITSQPIEMHTPAEKEAIKNRLTGVHTLEVNGVIRKFEIERVEVAAEGAVVYWSITDDKRLMRIIDIGSGTINIATIRDGYFIDAESLTLPFGTTSTGSTVQGVAGAIKSAMTRVCNKDDHIFLCGGSAEEMLGQIITNYPNSKVHYPVVELGNKPQTLEPKFGNAAGLYQLAKVIF